jgi:integrase
MARGKTGGIGNGLEIHRGKFRLRFTYNGTRYREWLSFSTATKNGLEAAQRKAKDVREDIRLGRFDYAAHFPNSGSLLSSSPASHRPGRSLKKMGDLYLQTVKNLLAPATYYQYECALKEWYEVLGADTKCREIEALDLEATVGGMPWTSARRRNNALIPLRALFAKAAKAERFDDPTLGLKNQKRQKKTPDPFDDQEREAILEYMRGNLPEQVWNFYEFAFFSGLRPEEQVALAWDHLDLRADEFKVEQTRSFRGELREHTKTYQERAVRFNARSREAIKRQMKWTRAKPHGFIFENPETGEPWSGSRIGWKRHGDREEDRKETYWSRALRALRMRKRRAYTTRHSFITWAIMNGANIEWVARQVGHTSGAMIHSTYFAWIERANQAGDREAAKLEQASGKAVPNWPRIGPKAS